MYRLVRINEVQYAYDDYRKERLLDEGFVLDESYVAEKPVEEVQEDEVKVEEDTVSSEFASLTREQLMDVAHARGLEVKGNISKKDLLALLEG